MEIQSLSKNIKKPRLIVADVDGTLTNDDRIMSEYTKGIFERLHKEGYLLGIASGRPLEKWMIEKYDEWELSFRFDFIIGLNGGQIWLKEDDKVYDFSFLPKEAVARIAEIMKPYFDKVSMQVYNKGLLQSNRLDELTKDSIARNEMNIEIVPTEVITASKQSKIMFRGFEEDVAEASEYSKQFDCEEFHSFKTHPQMLEFQDPKASKGDTLKKYCELHNIDTEEVWAFGDMTNDISLLEASGRGVCMLNGTEDIKAIADDITEYDNNEDGFARYIDKHLFQEDLWQK